MLIFYFITQWYNIYRSSGRVYVSASPENYDASEMTVTTPTDYTTKLK